ncbi:odorant receptor 309 [Tribolium castaneum]|uniref:Odorant receptor n=1 Tax=Tribolium castaneum TaxID=7070 RepID=D6X3T0_TRICA|nr:odorant receptor 309 [Tribolium castaneum]
MPFEWTIRKNKIKPILQNDVLLNLMLVPNTIISNKFLVILNYFYFGFIILQSVFVAVIIITKDEWKLLNGQYAGYTSGCAIVWSSYITMYTYVDKFLNLYKEIFPHLWSLDVVGQDHFNKFSKMAKVLKLGKNILLVVGFLSATVGLPWYRDEYEIIITVRVYKDYVDKWTTLLYFVLFSSLYHIALTVIFCVLCLVYMVLHLHNQCVMLNKRLEALDDEQLFLDNDNYQDFVTKELKFCIQQHQFLLKFAKRLNDILYYPTFYYVLSGVVTGVSLLLFPKNDIKNLLRCVLIIVLGGGFAISFCFLGQILENASEELLFSAYSARWYLWNIKNRKLLSVFLLKTQDNIVLSSSGIITINFRLLISLYQSIYSCLTFLLNIK